MSIEAMEDQLALISKQYEIDRKDIIRKYCIEISKASVGDIVTDHIGSVIVEKIGFYFQCWDKPLPTYFGFEITKAGKRRKNQSKRTVYGSNVLKVVKADKPDSIKCQWVSCEEPASVRIKRANTVVCDEHYIANVVQFGCTFETEPVNK